jgi:hypothetical protein
MSVLPPIADINPHRLERLLCARSRHSLCLNSRNGLSLISAPLPSNKRGVVQLSQTRYDHVFNVLTTTLKRSVQVIFFGSKQVEMDNDLET